MSEDDHAEFDQRLSDLEKDAQEQELRLKRIEIELGIFKGDREPMNGHA